MEGRVAVEICPAGGCPVLDELLDDSNVAPHRRNVHGGRHAEAVIVQVGFMLQQYGDCGRGPVQAGYLKGRLSPDIRPCLPFAVRRCRV